MNSAAETSRRRRQPGRGRRTESGRSRAEPRASLTREAANGARKPEELKELITTTQQAAGGAGTMEIKQKEDEAHGRETPTSTGSGASDGPGTRSASEPRDRSHEPESLRWRVNQLEKEKVELASGHNQELCRLEAEVTRLRSSVERATAQGTELQYQLTVSQRDADQLSRDKQGLTERAAELQQTVQELHRALDITRQARDEDQHALQQEVEERDKLIHSFGSENQRLHQLLQDQEEALEEMERRTGDVQKENEREADMNRRQADELKYLSEREERSRRESELLGQRAKCLESSLEAERATHLESKFTSELLQLRVQELEAALAAERSRQQEAQATLELLRARFREVERAYALERERGDRTERALQRLQTELEQNKCEQSVALETEKKSTSDLADRLQEEQRELANTRSVLQQAVKRQSDTEEVLVTCLTQIRETLQQHGDTGGAGPAEDGGSWGSAAEVLRSLKATFCSKQHKLEETQRQVQDLLLASERLHEDNQRLRLMTSDQSRQIQESQQVSLKLKEELTRLRHEGSDWSTQIHDLQMELQAEREDRKRETERAREEREREREERSAAVQQIRDHCNEESQVHLSFLYRLYQRLLAGCVLLDQPQSILGAFTWKELCDVISEQVDQLTSDLQKANDKISHLQDVCEKKSVCVRELRRSQAALTRLEEGARRRQEAWSSQHTHTLARLQDELQVCRSQSDSLRDHISSLDLRCASLTSDLSGLQGLLARSRKESACFFLASALLAGALKHTLCRLQALAEHKSLLSRQLAGRQALEEEVKRLADALGGEDAETAAQRGSRAVRRWRSAVCVLVAVRRWWTLANKTTVMFCLDRGAGASVCVCGDVAAATTKGKLSTSKAEGRDGSVARWLRSKLLASAILASMADLQGALAHTGSSPVDVTSAARSGLSRLLDDVFGQAERATGRREDALKLKSSQPNTKALVSTIQQHFLLFSQRLHSAEVERRRLRLEVANLKKGLRQESKDTCRTVPAERFRRVCDELRQALSREQEAQALTQQQTDQLRALQQRVDLLSSEQTDTQALAEARREVSRQERSLRILGKHLSEARSEKKQLEEKLQQTEDELRDASRRTHGLISYMKAAESSYKEVRDRLVQSERSPSDQPRLPLFPRMRLETSVAAPPEAAACQSLLSVVSQLFHTCSSRINWLEQEVSAHRRHVTALRSELQDACLHDNQAFVPVEFADMETLPSAPSSDLSDDPTVSKPSPTHLSPRSIAPEVKTKKPRKKNGGGRR